MRYVASGHVARALAFFAAVLVLPSLAFVLVAPRDEAAAGPAMLVLLFAPATSAFVVSRFAPKVERVPRRLGEVARAALVMAVVITFTTLVALFAGAAVVVPRFSLLGGLVGALPFVVTSVLEELGWATFAPRVVFAAFPRGIGTLLLSLVWAAWHLVVAVFGPRDLVESFFRRADALAPGPVLGFVAGCVAYRFLLVELTHRAGTSLAAIASHLVPNAILGFLLGSGALSFPSGVRWWAFPGPTGLPFALAALVAFVLVRRRVGGLRAA
jgi:membrane protease YdiL (CAAX protease family)